MSVTLVVAVAANGVIGRDGGLPWPRLEGDLPRFKALTTGHVMVMGSRTFDSMGQLPGRTSIVVSRQRRMFGEGVPVLPSVADAVAHGLGLDPEVFVVGGARIYADALSQGLVDTMVVSHVHDAHDGDTVFPDVDWSAWRETSREAETGYDVVTYVRA
ncbi:dihydrofolate reductase [Solicola sp. PLA-1-18]|uniref:dihydrofolate reductase n=1 Tax=Solicola sp. PLA-1-18 TaxID=3380532 RepID=UPI003B7AE1C4